MQLMDSNTPSPAQARSPQSEGQHTGQVRLSEESIAQLVDAFYAKVRRDPEIGPIFNEAVENWDAHLSLLTDFWSTVLLGTAKYKGNPLLAHFPLPVRDAHFERWLSLFGETAQEVLTPDDAALVLAKAQNIAANIKRVLAYRDQQLTDS